MWKYVSVYGLNCGDNGKIYKIDFSSGVDRWRVLKLAKHCFANLICKISRKHDLFDERYIHSDVIDTEYDTDVKKVAQNTAR